MSRIIEKEELTDGQIAYLYKAAKVSTLRTPRNPFPRPIKLWLFDGKCFWFPSSLPLPGKTFREHFGVKKYNAKFETTIELFDGISPITGLFCDQTRIFADALEDIANHGSVLLNLSTGFGKSLLMTMIIQALGRKALIIVYSTGLQKDIVTMLKAKTTAKVHHFTGTKEPAPDTQIDVIGMRKASTLSAKFLSRYQTVVFDEVDQLPAKGSLPMMKRMAPDYLIGLTATIERADGLHTALFKYWGDKKHYIKRLVLKPDVTLVKYQTNFVPEIEYDADGSIRNDILSNSIASNTKRHAAIERLVRSLRGKKILILSDRTDEILALYARLEDLDCDYKTGKKKDMDKEKRILIGGFKSCGRGYDVPGLEVVILLSSFRNVKQYEGRLRSHQGFIYDFVDCAPIFEARWKTRLTWYRTRDMKIKFQIDGMDEIRDYNPPRSQKRYEEVQLI